MAIRLEMASYATLDILHGQSSLMRSLRGPRNSLKDNLFDYVLAPDLQRASVVR